MIFLCGVCGFLAAAGRPTLRASGKPLLFDGSSQPKPAFHAVIAEAKTAAAVK